MTLRHNLLLLTLLVVVVRGDGWDDFSNNLAADLSPIIALFGEQVTKQFLSESTTLLDNFIFALAPLGILTAVVSAIRVSGGASLRAFIGRAQEGGGIAEAELCSSTSRDVCELYHNGAIVRVFGRPKILEIVHDREAHIDESSETLPKCGIYSFQDYIRSGSHRKAGWKEQNVKDHPQPDAEGQQNSSQNSGNDDGQFAPNPNLSFNIGIREQPPFVLWLAFSVGVLIQAGVLIFGALVTYTLRWTKDNALPPKWAFPLMLMGTLFLDGGMFFCAFIIENSTQERVFRRSSDCGENGSTIYVVQPGNQIIGDQTFDAFSYTDASRPLTKYTTSWKLQKKSEVQVGLATGITLAGFVLQFVGLRAMHSSVSVFQLGAILLMSIIRAGLRTQRLGVEQNLLRRRPDEVEGHELDWLALQMAQEKRDEPEKQDEQDESPKLWAVSGVLVKPKLPNDSHERYNNTAAKRDGNSRSNKQLARRIFFYRSRLAELTSRASGGKLKASTAWEDRLIKARSQARQLKKAVESSVSILFTQAQVKPEWKSIECFPWTIKAVGYDPEGSGESADVSIPLNRGNNSGKSMTTTWQVNQHYLEALIGLSTWSIVSHPNTEKDDEFQLKVSGASEIPAFRIMASGASEREIERGKTELKLWIEDSSFTTTDCWKGREDLITSHPGTLWEEQTVRHLSTSKPGQKAFRLYGWQNLPDDSQPETFILKSPTHNSISASCAHDIYGSFLCKFLEILESIGGETKLVRGSQGFIFMNEVVNRLAECFKESGLGSIQEGYSVIIPALRRQAKLPLSKEAIRSVPIQAENSRRDKNFQDAEDILRWAWETTLLIRDDESLAPIMLEFGELYRDMLLHDTSSTDFARRGISWMMNAAAINDSLKDSAAATVAARYAELEERSKNAQKFEPSTQDVIDMISKEDRVEALWLIGHVQEALTADGDDRTILSWAAQRGWVEIVKTALEIGSSVDHLDKVRRSALSYAAEHGHADIVEMLMRRGAMPIIADSLGRTPLSYAAGSCHICVMETLLDDHRVSVWTKDANNRSPLHWAAQNGHHESVAILFQHGAKVILDDQDQDGDSALDLAVSNHHRTAAEYLITSGAHSQVPIGKTRGLKWALQNGEWESAAFLLKQFGQRDNTTKTVVITLASDPCLRPPSNRDESVASDRVLPEIVLRELSEDGKQIAVTTNTIQGVAYGRYGVKVEVWEQRNGVSSLEPVELELPSLSLPGPIDYIERPDGFIPTQYEKIDISWTTEIIGLLLGYLGNDTKTTIEAWIAAIDGGPVVIGTLLDRMTEDFELTESILEKALETDAHQCEDLITTRLLFDQRITIKIEDEQLISMLYTYESRFKKYSEKALRLLLFRQGEINVPESIVHEVVGDSYGPEMLQILLDRGHSLAVTENVVCTAAGQRHGDSLLKLLIDQGYSLPITENVVCAAAREYYGISTLELLVGQGYSLPVTENTICAAIKCDGMGGNLRALLEGRREDPEVTLKVIEAAAKLRHDGHKLGVPLFGGWAEIEVTDEVIKLIAKSSHEEVRARLEEIRQRQSQDES